MSLEAVTHVLYLMGSVVGPTLIRGGPNRGGARILVRNFKGFFRAQIGGVMEGRMDEADMRYIIKYWNSL